VEGRGEEGKGGKRRSDEISTLSLFIIPFKEHEHS
jgi:hypothetical protein